MNILVWTILFPLTSFPLFSPNVFVEQAMSIMNNEVVDLTENDPSLVVTPSFPVTTQPTQQIQAPAVTSNATASILPSVLPSAVPQPQPQPKVS